MYCMSEWTSISVTEEQKAKIEAEKPDGMSMGAFLVSVIESNSSDIDSNATHIDSNSAQEIAELVSEEIASGNVKVNAEDIAEELKNEISMANEPGVEVDTKSIINRIDDLESQLPAKIAEELR